MNNLPPVQSAPEINMYHLVRLFGLEILNTPNDIVDILTSVHVGLGDGYISEL